MTAADPVLAKVLAWAEAEAAVRAVVLTSTARERPPSPSSTTTAKPGLASADA